MAKKTKTQEAIEYLLAHNCQEVESKTRKYRIFKRNDCGTHYLVGKAGAIRVNHHGPKVDGSLSITDNFRKVI